MTNGETGPATVSAADSGVVAERRVCSLLFADLVGFTPITEARDPEEVRELLSRYFEIARTIVARYGGVVEKFIGDAVMAVWGTPVAVEGDTERAVRAGLDLVDAVKGLGAELRVAGLALRAGVTTGDVAVNVGVAGEGMVAGDAVNTAARIQASAEPGETWVDEATRRLAEASVGFEDRGEHLLKGKSSPVRLWAATRVLSGVGGSQRVDGLEAPMLGRDAELRTVKELFHAAAERRTPRLVVVAGPPGVGKSRLGWEFEKYVDGLSDTVLWHRGRCLAFGDGVAFWALAEAIRQRFAIAEDDPVAVAADKVAGGLEAILPDADERAYVGARLARLLGIPWEAERSASLGREELFAGWRLFLERLAEQDPVALLVEDAQYADPGLLDFLDHLVDWARDVPIFVLVFGRPELLRARPGFGTGRNRSVLSLDPLDARSMDQLLDALVPRMPPQVRDQLAARAQGNPLFAMETIRSLIDRDTIVPREGQYALVGNVGGLVVPDSLHGLLASRLDALGPELRSLVAKAAVLGGSFHEEALVATSGQSSAEVRAALSELVRREVLTIVTDPLSPQRGAFEFSQDMLREVAYETLSRRDRKALHLVVAEHLRSAYANEGEEVSEVIAQHYIAALTAVPDAADVQQLRDQAISALVRSAERSSRAGSPRSASRAYARAAEIAETSPDIPVEDAAVWWERAAESSLTAADQEDLVAQARRAAQLFEEAGHPRSAARCQSLVGRGLARLGRHTEAREVMNSAIAALRVDPDSDTVRAIGWLAYLEAFAGSPLDGERLILEALALAQAIDADDALVADLFVGQGIALIAANRFHEAIAAYEYAAQAAERANDGALWGRALANLSDALTPIDPARAAQVAQAACEQARRVGDRDTHVYALGNLAMARLEMGHWDQVQDLFETEDQAEDVTVGEVLRAWRSVTAALVGNIPAAVRYAELTHFRASEDPQDRSSAELCDALIADADGRPADALAHARSVLQLVEFLGVRHEAVRWVWPLAAHLAVAHEDMSTVEDLLRVLDAHPTGHLPALLRTERDLVRAELMARRGEPGAEDCFVRAVAALEQVGNPYRLAWGLVDYAELLITTGRADEAVPHLDQAREIAERLGCEPLKARVASAESRVAKLPPANSTPAVSR